MKMLNPDIVEFIGQIKSLNTVGGLIVPRSSVDGLIDIMNCADVVVGPDVRSGRVTYYSVGKESCLTGFVLPAILIVIEEDFDGDASYAERIREIAAYMKRVK